MFVALLSSRGADARPAPQALATPSPRVSSRRRRRRGGRPEQAATTGAHRGAFTKTLRA